MRPIRLALCGTFDRLTYGDALASLIIEHALQQRLESLTLVRYASSARSAASWPFEVRSLDDFQRDMPDLTGVLVGNLGTLSLSPSSGDVAPDGNIHPSADTWLVPAMAAVTSGISVCWNSVDIGNVRGGACPLLTFVLSLSRYVSVRDEHIVSALRAAGFMGDCPIVPSALFDVPQLVPGKLTADRRPDEVNELLGPADAAKDYVVVQDDDRHQAHMPELQVALAQRSIAYVLLPLETAQLSLRPETIAALIGHSAGVIAWDEGLVMTALAYGLPAWSPQSGEPRNTPPGEDEDLTASTAGHRVPAAFLERLGSFVPWDKTRNASSVLDVHWNNVAARFSTSSAADPSAPSELYLASNQMLAAVSHSQDDQAATLPSTDSLAETAATENDLRNELKLAQASLAQARAQHLLEANLHQTWHTAADQRQAEAEVERQRLKEMKHCFDAALHALMEEIAALKNESAATLETLHQSEALLHAREVEVDLLRSSLSWRLTGPLRVAKDAWRTRQR